MIKRFYSCERKLPIGFNLYFNALEYRLAKIFKLENKYKIIKGII